MARLTPADKEQRIAAVQALQGQGLGLRATARQLNLDPTQVIRARREAIVMRLRAACEARLKETL